MINYFFDTYKEVFYQLGRDEHERGLGLYLLWFDLDDLYIFGKISKNLKDDYLLKIDIFLQIILYLLNNNYMKLGNDGNFIDEPIERQIQNFRKSFPKNSQVVDAHLGSWFFTKDCYAGAVWIYKLEEGKDAYVWT